MDAETARVVLVAAARKGQITNVVTTAERPNYQPVLESRQGRNGYRDDRLDVACWCQRSIVKVAPAEVLAGRTASCGTRRCERLDESH